MSALQPLPGTVATPRAPLWSVQPLAAVDYVPTWHAMQAFTAGRDDHTRDELWLVEHPPVYTLGWNGKREHLHTAGDIPVIVTDRGGQITYHGPGQLLAYTLLDLRRLHIGVRDLVNILQQSVLDLLAQYDVVGALRDDAPGVYVDGKKIAALGLRVKRGRCYHGLALNVNMDLAPFSRINPCGYADLEVTQLADLGIDLSAKQAADALQSRLATLLGYTGAPYNEASHQ